MFGKTHERKEEALYKVRRFPFELFAQNAPSSFTMFLLVQGQARVAWVTFHGRRRPGNRARQGERVLKRRLPPRSVLSVPDTYIVVIIPSRPSRPRQLGPRLFLYGLRVTCSCLYPVV